MNTIGDIVFGTVFDRHCITGVTLNTTRPQKVRVRPASNTKIITPRGGYHASPTMLLLLILCTKHKAPAPAVGLWPTTNLWCVIVATYWKKTQRDASYGVELFGASPGNEGLLLGQQVVFSGPLGCISGVLNHQVSTVWYLYPEHTVFRAPPPEAREFDRYVNI